MFTSPIFHRFRITSRVYLKSREAGFEQSVEGAKPDTLCYMKWRLSFLHHFIKLLLKCIWFHNFSYKINWPNSGKSCILLKYNTRTTSFSAYSDLLIRKVFTNNPYKFPTQLVSTDRDTSLIKSYGRRFKKYWTTTVSRKSGSIYIKCFVLID